MLLYKGGKLEQVPVVGTRRREKEERRSTAATRSADPHGVYAVAGGYAYGCRATLNRSQPIRVCPVKAGSRTLSAQFATAVIAAAVAHSSFTCK